MKIACGKSTDKLLDKLHLFLFIHFKIFLIIAQVEKYAFQEEKQQLVEEIQEILPQNFENEERKQLKLDNEWWDFKEHWVI